MNEKDIDKAYARIQTRLLSSIIDQMRFIDITFWERLIERMPLLREEEKIHKKTIIAFLDFYKKIIKNISIFSTLKNKN